MKNAGFSLLRSSFLVLHSSFAGYARSAPVSSVHHFLPFGDGAAPGEFLQLGDGGDMVATALSCSVKTIGVHEADSLMNAQGDRAGSAARGRSR